MSWKTEKRFEDEENKEIIASQTNRRKSVSKKSILFKDACFLGVITRIYKGNSAVGESDYGDGSDVLA